MACAAIRSMAVVLLLLIHCFMLFSLVCGGSVFDLCFVLHCLVTFLALASGPVPSLFKIRSCCQKWPRPGDHIGYIGIT